MKSFVVACAVTLAVGSPAFADPAIGATAPEFTLTDEAGAKHQLSQYKGKIVVLEWTNPDCPYVKRHYDANTMESLAKKLPTKDVVWLAVNSTHSNQSKDTQAWKKREGLTYATLQDPEGKVGQQYGARTTPHMFVIDREGKLAYSGAIDSDPSGDEASPTNYVSAAVNALLAGKRPEVASTKPYGCSVKYASK